MAKDNKKLITGGSPVLRITDRYDSDTASRNVDEQASTSRSGELVPYVPKDSASRPSQTRGLPKVQVTVPLARTPPTKSISIPAMEFSSTSLAADAAKAEGRTLGETTSSKQWPSASAATRSTTVPEYSAPVHIDAVTFSPSPPVYAASARPGESSAATLPPAACPVANEDSCAVGITIIDGAGCVSGSCATRPVEMAPLPRLVLSMCFHVTGELWRVRVQRGRSDADKEQGAELLVAYVVWFQELLSATPGHGAV